MQQFFVHGQQLHSERDILTMKKKDREALRALSAPDAKRRRRAGPLADSVTDAGGPMPIGIGKPLTIETRYIYYGDLPRQSGTIFDRSPDCMVSTALKRLPMFDGAPRAVTAVVKDTQSRTGWATRPATEPWTPLVYYSPALTDRGLLLTYDLTFDGFPEGAFQTLSRALGSAAGIPVFAPASAYLMAGSVITRLAGSIGEWLSDGEPAFSASLEINTDRPLFEDTQPGFMVLTHGDLAEQIRAGAFRFSASRGVLENGQGKAYDGAVPYIVVTLDGSERDDYKNFTPTMASAALLDRFLHTGEGRPKPTDLVLDVMKAYNDLSHREEALTLSRRIAEVGAGSEEGKKLKARFDAYVKNIMDPSLRPAL